VPGCMAICSFDDPSDPEGFGIRKTHHLLELPPLEEEGIAFTLLGIDHLAWTVEFSLFEIAIEALSGLI
jgi:hypothetical protein